MKGGQSGGAQSGGGWGQSGYPPWLGMAQNYFGGGGGGGYGMPGGAMPPNPYQQGGAMSGADPYGGAGGAFPTYTGPPRDQPLGAPPSPPSSVTNVPPGASTPMPVGDPTIAQAPGLLGGASGGQNPTMGNNMSGLFNGGGWQGWHNRGYGIPGQTAPGQMPMSSAVQPGGQTAVQPSQITQPQQYQMPYGLPPGLSGLFGGYM